MQCGQQLVYLWHAFNTCVHNIALCFSEVQKNLQM